MRDGDLWHPVDDTMPPHDIIDLLRSTIGAEPAEKTMGYIHKVYEDGVREGREKGREEGRRALLLSLIERKFGADEDLAARLLAASDRDLESLTERFLIATSLDDLKE